MNGKSKSMTELNTNKGFQGSNNGKGKLYKKKTLESEESKIVYSSRGFRY